MEEDEESLTERQNSELELLQSIYGHQVEDLRSKDAWKVIFIIIYLTKINRSYMLHHNIPPLLWLQITGNYFKQ